MENEVQQNIARVNRRQLFGSAASGVGAAALASLLGNGNLQAAGGSGLQGLADLPHHLAKAKRVVLFWQGGGPSHIDLFDPKPVLREMEAKISQIPSEAARDCPPCPAGMVSGPAFLRLSPFKSTATRGLS